ncbi:hypothetical protein HYV31_02615 [candidate division WWE3 bacterium]|nr:hypothetical protein [candidate division WWE3 bacterium]
MPKFLFPIILIDAFTWFKVYQAILQRPTSLNQVYWFLFVVFIAVTLTLTLFLFWIFTRQNQQIPNPRPLFRKALKYSVVLTTGPIIYLTLRACNLATAINSTLLAALYVMILLRLGSKKPLN